MRFAQPIQNGWRIVGGAIVDGDDFQIGLVEGQHGAKRRFDCGGFIQRS